MEAGNATTAFVGFAEALLDGTVGLAYPLAAVSGSSSTADELDALE